MPAKFIMHAAKTVIARQGHGLLHLFHVQQFNRMIKPLVTFGNETILLPLPFGHRNQDAAFLMFGRVAEQFVHLWP